MEDKLLKELKEKIKLAKEIIQKKAQENLGNTPGETVDISQTDIQAPDITETDITPSLQQAQQISSSQFPALQTAEEGVAPDPTQYTSFTPLSIGEQAGVVQTSNDVLTASASDEDYTPLTILSLLAKGASEYAISLYTLLEDEQHG
jgi:hypothetical protein